MGHMKNLQIEMNNGDAFQCVLCDDVIRTAPFHGNNPEPLMKNSYNPESANEGRCCDECNSTKVIPARMRDSAFLERRRQQNTELRNTAFRDLEPEMRDNYIKYIRSLASQNFFNNC